MSVKSIGYQKGVNYGSKKFVVPDITINAGGQIVDIDSTNTPTNVVISGEIEDLSQTINKDGARLARLVDSEAVIQTELDAITSVYTDLQTQTDALQTQIDALYADVTSQDAPILLYSFDSTQDWVNVIDSDNGFVNIYNRPGPYNDPTNDYQFPIGTEMNLKKGNYFLDVRLMLVSNQGTWSVGGNDIDLKTPTGYSNVLGEVGVYLGSELINTFVSSGTDYYMGQIYLNGSCFINVPADDTVLSVKFWFTGNLPYNLDVVTNGESAYAWSITSSPKWTYPIELGFGNFNSFNDGAPCLSLWELNYQ